MKRFGSAESARNARRRLAVALVLSAVLHGAFLVSVSGRPTYPAAAPGALHARLIEDAPGVPVVVAPVPPAPIESSGPVAARTTIAPARERPPRTATARAPGKVRGALEAADASPVALAVPRDPTWYSARELDELPRPLRPIRPKLQPLRGEAQAQGRVVLRLLIDENGVVTEASVLEAEPAGDFAQRALAAGRETRFRPGSKSGRIVKSRVLLELTFGPG